MVVDNRVSVWDRLLATDDHPLTREAADYILRIRFNEADNRRLEELAERCRLGELTPAQRAEYEEYVRAGLVLATWQSRARMALRAGGGANGAENG
jgi:hypothetical protein